MKCIKCRSKMKLNEEKQWECTSCDFKLSKPHVETLSQNTQDPL